MCIRDSLLPKLVDLIVDYRAMRGPSRSGHLVERDDGKPFDRRTIQRYVATVAKRAGIGHCLLYTSRCV